MQLAHFDEFLRGLHDEIVRLEFTHYDFKNQVCLLSAFPMNRLSLYSAVQEYSFRL